MKEAFVGFDSAWTGKNKGAICCVMFQGDKLERAEVPRPSSFTEAVRIVSDLRGQSDDILVAIDQPIIVCNQHGSRRVDQIAHSLMTRLGSAAQPANLNKAAMFGPKAPIRKFISKVSPSMDFEAAKSPAGHTHLVEVYPALALPALEPHFMKPRHNCRRWAARYNPKNSHFDLSDWKLVCRTVQRYAGEIGLDPLSSWAEKKAGLDNPRKPDQDKVDAAICLIIALQWRRCRQKYGLEAFGDLESGYIVTPTSSETLEILQSASERVFA